MKKIIVVVWSMFLVILLAVIGVVMFKLVNLKRYNEQISLGDKYLRELDYENAELCYQQAIQIDDKRTKPYLELANVYIEQGQIDDAIDILETAKTVIDSEELRIVEYKLSSIQSSASDLEGNQTTSPSDLEGDQTTEAIENVEVRYIKSNYIQEYKGKVYSVLPPKSQDMIRFESGYDINHASDFIIYEDYVYMMVGINVGGGLGEERLVRMKLDCSDMTTISEYVDHSRSFFICDNVLYFGEYYHDGDFDGRYYIRTLDLSTLESGEYEDYRFICGDENTRVFERVSDSRICYTKGTLAQIKESPIILDNDWEEFGIIEDNIYFTTYDEAKDYRSNIERCSLLDGSRELVFFDNIARVNIFEGKLYYLDKVETLREMNFTNGDIEYYDIRSLELEAWQRGNHPDYSWGGIVNISESTIYFWRNTSDSKYNNELWSLCKETGALERKGRWYTP